MSFDDKIAISDRVYLARSQRYDVVFPGRLWVHCVKHNIEVLSCCADMESPTNVNARMKSSEYCTPEEWKKIKFIRKFQESQ